MAVWLYKEQLTVEYHDTQLAHYTVTYKSDGKYFQDVSDPDIYETQYRSPQLPLREFSDAEWLKILRLPRYGTWKKLRSPTLTQLRLFQ